MPFILIVSKEGITEFAHCNVSCKAKEKMITLF